MSKVKISGCCTVCDKPCFDIRARFAEHELYPGEPKQIGRPNDDALKISFFLLDGTIMHLTFCGKCAESLSQEKYLDIWRKVIRSWERELKDETPSWYLDQFGNGLLVELGRRKWSQV